MYNLLALCKEVDRTNIFSINHVMQRLGMLQYNDNTCRFDEKQWNKAILFEDHLYQEINKGVKVLLVTHEYYPYQREIQKIDPIEFLAEATFKDFTGYTIYIDQCVYFSDMIYMTLNAKGIKPIVYNFSYDVNDKTIGDLKYLIKQYADSCELYKSPIAHYYHVDRRNFILYTFELFSKKDDISTHDKQTIDLIIDKLTQKTL